MTYVVSMSLYTCPMFSSRCCLMAGNFEPFTPTIPNLPTLPSLRRSNKVRPTT